MPILSTTIGACKHVNMSNKSVTEYNGHSDPPLEGTTVSFSCPPRQELIGPNASICTNGSWDPDPTETECKGIASCTYDLSLLF